MPVCDYTGEDDEPCEEPVQERRWSSASVIVSAAVGALVGGLLVSAVLVWAIGLVPGSRPLTTVGEQVTTSTPTQVTIKPGAAMAEVSEAVAEKVLAICNEAVIP